MFDLEPLRRWLMSCPGLEGLSVDYHDPVPGSSGLNPAGVEEIGRTEDLLGNVAVECRITLWIYAVMAKAPGDLVGARDNANRILELQRWIREQSLRGAAPVFGDVPERERITAGNGVLFAADEEGTGTYRVKLSVYFVKRYEEM